jgi:hypothetical protein
MKQFQAILFIILIILVSYIGMEKSGLINYFNTMINQEEGWTKTNNGYIRTRIETTYIISTSLLKDPEKNSFNIYQGAMKKTALDRMQLVTIVTIEVSEISEMKLILAKQAKKFKCNTAIVNRIFAYNKAVSEAFSIGVF